MNGYRLIADLLHLASIFILLLKIINSNSVSGISLKSQLLYLTVFIARYADLFWNFVSVYNTFMKTFFIGSSAYVAHLIYFKHYSTYSVNEDKFRAEFLVILTAILACIFHERSGTFEIFWMFSIYLEAVAILPQLYMVKLKGGSDSITKYYLLALGGYRALYVANWVYRFHQNGYFHPHVIVAGIFQTLFYSIFAIFMATRKNKHIRIPSDETNIVSENNRTESKVKTAEKLDLVDNRSCSELSSSVSSTDTKISVQTINTESSQ